MPPTGPRSPQGVPRIIVISPTTESSLINQDSVSLEDSIESMENNVFVTLNFSSEVFEALELLSWPTGLLITLPLDVSGLIKKIYIKLFATGQH